MIKSMLVLVVIWLQCVFKRNHPGSDFRQRGYQLPFIQCTYVSALLLFLLVDTFMICLFELGSSFQKTTLHYLTMCFLAVKRSGIQQLVNILCDHQRWQNKYCCSSYHQLHLAEIWYSSACGRTQSTAAMRCSNKFILCSVFAAHSTILLLTISKMS